MTRKIVTNSIIKNRCKRTTYIAFIVKCKLWKGRGTGAEKNKKVYRKLKIKHESNIIFL